MNDMEEEIDRTEKISYRKINNHYINSQIAYTIKQGYTCIVLYCMLCNEMCTQCSGLGMYM